MTLWGCQSPLLAWKHVGNEHVNIDKHLSTHFWAGWAGSCPLSRGWTLWDSWAHTFRVLLCGLVEFLHGSPSMEDWQVATNATCPWPCICAISGALSKRWRCASSFSVACLRRGKLDKDWLSIYFGDCSPDVLRNPYIPPPQKEAQTQPLGEAWPRSACCLSHSSSIRRWWAGGQCRHSKEQQNWLWGPISLPLSSGLN